MIFVNGFLGAVLAVGATLIGLGIAGGYIILMGTIYQRIEDQDYNNRGKATAVVTAISILVGCVIFGVVCQIVGGVPWEAS